MTVTPCYDPQVIALLEAFGAEVRRAAVLVGDLLAAHPERPELAGELKACEHEGDRIAHDLIHALGAHPEVPAPFEPADGLRLASALDDIVDFAEQAADMLGLYAVEASMEQAIALAGVLVDATRQVAGALGALGTGEDLGAFLADIHRLENDGDRMSRAAVASLFADGIDPMVVIRWKDIFDALEAAIDACEDVAHLLEGVDLKRRHVVGAPPAGD